MLLSNITYLCDRHLWKSSVHLSLSQCIDYWIYSLSSLSHTPVMAKALAVKSELGSAGCGLSRLFWQCSPVCAECVALSA